MGQRSLHDRRVIITGASRGVGRALALELAPLGSRLLLTSRSEEPLRELVAEAAKLGAVSADIVVGDVTDPEVHSRLSAYVADQWGGLDTLVNNAGVSAHGRFAKASESTLRQIMEVNLFAPAELTRRLLPMLKAGRDPLVVNIGSVLGHRAVPFNSEYCASKFALRGWSESLRAELSRDRIEVLMVSPGSIDTEFFDHLLADQENTPWAGQKGIPPEAVARQVVRAMRRRQHEIYPNWRGRLLVGINRLCPRLVDWVLSRYG
jgi:short-subunit dehydrogenase